MAGPSGSGKSSLVRAGLVPALVGRGRSVAVLNPGNDADRRPDDRDHATPTTAAVLVIDQFEELFTLASSTDEVAAFLSRVAAYAIDRGPGRDHHP